MSRLAMVSNRATLSQAAPHSRRGLGFAIGGDGFISPSGRTGTSQTLPRDGREYADAMRVSGSNRTLRRWLFLPLLVAGLVLLVLASMWRAAGGFTLGCVPTTGFGGPSCWWDQVPWVIHDVIRGVWSILTGQPLTRDLFPF
jgi:hypothetical protein